MTAPWSYSDVFVSYDLEALSFMTSDRNLIMRVVTFHSVCYLKHLVVCGNDNLFHYCCALSYLKERHKKAEVPGEMEA